MSFHDFLRNVFFAGTILLSCAALYPDSVVAGDRIEIKPIFTIEEEYTDNLFLSDQIKERDFITTVTPGILIEAKARTRDVSFLYEVGRSFYDRFSENDSWRQHSLLNGYFSLGRHTRVDFRNDFLITEEPTANLRDILLESDNSSSEPVERIAETETVRRSREKYTTDTAHLAFTHDFSPYDSLIIQYDFDFLDNQDPSVRDKIRHRPAAAFKYWISPDRLGLEGGAYYSREDVSDSTAQVGYRQDSIHPSTYLLYWAIPERLFFRTGIAFQYGEYTGGEQISDLVDDPNQKYSSYAPVIEMKYISIPQKFGVDAMVMYEIGENDIGRGFSNPTDNFESWKGSLAFIKLFSRQLKGFVRYDHGIVDFDGEEADYTVYAPAIGFEYLLTRDLPLIFSLGYAVRDLKVGSADQALIFNGELGKWRFVKDGALSFKAASGYDESNYGAERLGFGWYYNAEALAEYQFSRYLTGTMSGFYEKNQYTDYETQRDDATLELTTGLVFKPDSWYSLRLDYSYRTVDSTLEENDYTENRVFLEIVLSPHRPFQF